MENIDSIINEHGGSFGVPEDPKERYGTRDQEVLNSVNMLIHADGANNVDQLLKNLPDESVKQIVEIRYRNSANLLTDRYLGGDRLESASKKVTLDLKILSTLVNQNRNLYGKDINASYLMGDENYQDIFGLLDNYEGLIKDSGHNIPLNDMFAQKASINPETGQEMNATDMIEQVKEQAKNKANEMGISTGSKSI